MFLHGMKQHQRGAALLGIMSNQLIELRFKRLRNGKVLLFSQFIWNLLNVIRNYFIHPFHRSHSPMTKSNEPKMATTSLTMCPGSSFGKLLRFTNDGDRIFSRYAVPPPLLLM